MFTAAHAREFAVPACQGSLEPGLAVHGALAGTWFGAAPCDGTAWALVGCTVAPGFQFRNFEMGDRERLLAEFPAARGWIERLMA